MDTSGTMTAMKTKSALSYFGSDSEVAASLAALLDGRKHVTIPFVGGAAILPHLTAKAIVANDLHDHAIVFYRVMAGCMGPNAKEYLIKRCAHTLSHPAELVSARSQLGSTCEADSAWAFWALCWIGRKGKGGTQHQGGMPSVRRTANGGTNASRIRAAANDLHGWAEQFERCEWENVCFRQLIPKIADRPDCGVYCDPPWIGAGRNYLHAFTEQDHRDLAELLQRFEQTAIVVRYGDDPLLRELYPAREWYWIDAESRTQANKVRGEVWITKNLFLEVSK